MIHVGLNLSPTEDLRTAALPLFEAGEVDAIEWNLDMGFSGVPTWVDALLEFYGSEGRLVAHGVEYSMLTAGQEARRARWLEQMDVALGAYSFAHLTEHYGWMTAGEIVGGTPLPHPFTTAALEVGHRHLDRLRERARIPVGLENLGLALCARDVDHQPDFLEALLAPSDGFLLLDLHNLLCQAENFNRDPQELLRRYPLGRVREVHLAGGSHLTTASGRRVRRDDHERPIPDTVLALLKTVLARCERLSFIFLEYADNGLRTSEDVAALHRQLREVQALVDESASTPVDAKPTDVRRTAPELVEGDIAAQQRVFLHTLEDARDAHGAQHALVEAPVLAPWRSWIEGFDPAMLELAHLLFDRWGERRPRAVEGESLCAELEAVGRIRVRHRALPVPGPGRVLLRVEAAGLCGTDVAFFRGALEARFPLSLGHETVGIVDALGEGVRDLAVGDRVIVPWAQGSCGACAMCLRGDPRMCRALETWASIGGSFREHTLAIASACVKVPDGLDAWLAAPLACAGHTVYGALDAAKPSKGDRVAIVGLGGLGHLAVQLAKARGHEVFAVTANPTKAADAARFGADEVLITETPAERLAQADGADVIVVTSASSRDLGSLARALRPRGRLVVAGLGRDAIEIDPNALIQRGATVIGALSGGRESLTALLGLAVRGEVIPAVERYPLAQLKRALYRLEDRRVRYRAVIVPG